MLTFSRFVLATRVPAPRAIAYARRTFFEVWEATNAPIAEDSVRHIARPYKIEAEIVGKSEDIRLATRQDRSRRLLDPFHV